MNRSNRCKDCDMVGYPCISCYKKSKRKRNFDMKHDRRRRLKRFKRRRAKIDDPSLWFKIWIRIKKKCWIWLLQIKLQTKWKERKERKKEKEIDKQLLKDYPLSECCEDCENTIIRFEVMQNQSDYLRKGE